MNHQVFSGLERGLAFLAGMFNLAIGTAFLFLPELQERYPLPIWPSEIPAVLTRFIGAIIIANGMGALWLAREREWARVRALAIVAVVYGTIVAGSLYYHLVWLKADPLFWIYFFFTIPFLIVFYILFIYHDIVPWFLPKPKAHKSRGNRAGWGN